MWNVIGDIVFGVVAVVAVVTMCVMLHDLVVKIRKGRQSVEEERQEAQRRLNERNVACAEYEMKLAEYRGKLKDEGYFPENIKDAKGEYLLATERTYHCCSRCRFHVYGCRAIEKPRRINVVNDCKFFDFDDSYLNLAAAYERVRRMTRIETGACEYVDFCNYDFKGGELLARSAYRNNLFVVNPEYVSVKVDPELDVSAIVKDADFRYVVKRSMRDIEKRVKKLRIKK